ncbi:crAss001_48 related protein [Kiloniella antarctica]|uniref:Uncharacterized protein n=1 Tax=Kiloniella antarctica TaxID=1550907 RepID=A0ABW5BP28_9PROT
MSEEKTHYTEWQSRVIHERDELQSKLQKLKGFIDSGEPFGAIDKGQRDALFEQWSHMTKYLRVLNWRIVRFSSEEGSGHE